MAGGVAAASLNGTLELLVLSAAGGYLAHLGVLRGGAVVTLSTSTCTIIRLNANLQER